MPNKFIWFPKKSHHGYFDKALARNFNSKSEKRYFINHQELHEDGSMESERHRVDRLAEQINEERKKQGLKSKTVSELRGTV